MFLLVTAVGSITVLSQAIATSELRGTVTDANGAAVAGATVTATDSSKGISRTVTTNSEGNFVLLSLSPSTYSVKITASGFASKTTNNVMLEVGQQLTLDLALTVGNVDVVVDVSEGDQPLVDTERTQQSTITAASSAISAINRLMLEIHLTPTLPENHPTIASSLADRSAARSKKTAPSFSYLPKVCVRTSRHLSPSTVH